jgi:hypothetical protein
MPTLGTTLLVWVVVLVVNTAAEAVVAADAVAHPPKLL